jgi:hypothetical protein
MVEASRPRCAEAGLACSVRSGSIFHPALERVWLTDPHNKYPLVDGDRTTATAGREDVHAMDREAQKRSLPP